MVQAVPVLRTQALPLTFAVLSKLALSVVVMRIAGSGRALLEQEPGVVVVGCRIIVNIR